MNTVEEKIVVPHPGQIVKDHKTGEFGKLEFYGIPREINVKLEGGKTDVVNINQLPRRYKIVDPDSEEYQNHLRVKKLKKDLEIKRQLFQQAIGEIKGLARSRDELRMNVPIRQALQAKINELMDLRDKALEDIKAITTELRQYEQQERTSSESIY